MKALVLNSGVARFSFCTVYAVDKYGKDNVVTCMINTVSRRIL